MAKVTPMMQQYKKIKEEYPDAVLLFRVGDFYETFFEDAVTASKELEITLTSRDGKKEDAVPLAGFPYHAASGYIARLLEKGFKIAVCEQVENPAQAQGLVKREVIRVITPGTRIEDNLLEEDMNNYLATIYLSEKESECGLAVADVSTGEIMVFQFSGLEGMGELKDEISRLQPAEILFLNAGKNRPAGRFVFEDMDGNWAVNYLESFPDRQTALEFLQELNCPSLLESAGRITSLPAFLAAASTLRYIKEMQKAPLSHFQKILVIEKGAAMSLDAITLRNLEIFATIRSREKEGSLFTILNRTRTPMGGRLLRKWLQRPLLERDLLSLRWDAVEELKHNPFFRAEIKRLLKDTCDLERFCARLNLGQIGPREMLSLKKTLQLMPALKTLLAETKAALFKKMREEIDDFAPLTEELEQAIDESAPFAVKDGNIFKTGYATAIDELRQISGESRNWMLELERLERERTGIRTLKVGFNKVFGYYLEVTKSNQERVPPNYIRKQTLVNAERFITQELKEKEELILHAEERLVELETELFQKLCQKVAEFTPQLQLTGFQIANLDCLFSLAEVASVFNYVKPSFSEDGSILIRGCRHPVVEQTGEELFIPNDIFLDNDKQRIQIITGPNMAGKSTYCRSAALVLIMAQAGSFVPAEAMAFTPLKRIFARVGASDDLSRGRSTFMVEMEETASILTGAGEDCLVLLDEIGRGTSTYDGMSLARAILEYLHGKPGSRVLFSTHYHELTILEEQLQGVKNYTVSVKEKGDTVIFLRKVVPGKADRSYGINVARMAGLPEEVILQAQKYLKELEETKPPAVSNREKPSGQQSAESTLSQGKKGQLSLFPETGAGKSAFSRNERKIIEELRELNLVNITPLEALVKLFSLQNRLAGREALHIKKDG